MGGVKRRINSGMSLRKRVTYFSKDESNVDFEIKPFQLFSYWYIDINCSERIRKYGIFVSDVCK